MLVFLRDTNAEDFGTDLVVTDINREEGIKVNFCDPRADFYVKRYLSDFKYDLSDVNKEFFKLGLNAI